MGEIIAKRIVAAVFVAVLCLFGVPAQAQQPELTELVSIETVNAELERVEANEELDAAVKDRLIELYEQAQAQIRAREEWRRRAQEFAAARRAIPERIAEAEQQLLERMRRPDADEFADLSAAELQDALAEWEMTETRVREQVAELEKEPARRMERRREIPELRRAARERLESATAAFTAPEISGEPSEVTRARRLAAQTQIQAIEAELQAYDAELSSYEEASQLLTLRSDVATRRLAQADYVAALLRDLVIERQQEEAREAARQARERLLQVSNPPPGIRQLAEELNNVNQQLVLERTAPEGLLANLKKAGEAVDALDAELAELEKHRQLAEAKVEVAQGTAIIGQLLQLELASLPDARELAREVRARAYQIGEVQLQQIEYTEQRGALANIDVLVERQLDAHAPGAAEDQREAMAEALRQGYLANRRALDALIADSDAYLTRLVELNAKQQELIDKAEAFRLFINEHILWTRSSTPINRRTLPHTIPAFLALFDLQGLLTVPVGFWSDIAASPMLYVLLFIVCTGFIAGRKHFRRQLIALGMEAARPSQTKQSLTFRALLYTLAYAVSLPLPLILLTYRATSPYVALAPSADAVCAGLFWGGVGWAILEAIRVSLMPHGLCLSHLRWGDDACKSARQHLKVFMTIGLPLTALLAAFDRLGDSDYYHSAGRFVFLGLLLLLLVLARSLFRPGKAVVLRIFRTFWDNRALRAERFWYIIAVLTPVILGAAAGIGYFYSAVQLYSKLAITLIAFYGILIAGGMAVRWSLLERRRITVEQWKKKYSGKDGGDENEPQMDLVRVDTQITRMLRFVFLFSIAGVVFAVWSDVFPALGVLDNIEVWSTSETVTVTETDANNIDTAVSEVRVVSITLRHVLIGLAILAITMIAVRDLPGFLELAVLQRTALGTGERYAITSITSYVVALVGIIVALNEVGLGWGRLQWLVAALGLGLGFGLQEIFANFVSGLILLFERPIRVGDVVTVGDVTGRVSRINIRATWITNFNRRDLVVPNKEFVTGQLVNWTLSDSVLRIEVPVGIAYGSDVRKAKQLILKCAKECPLALKDPAPEVYFFSFGDNALGLELRIFSPNLDNYLAIKDHMHQAIDDAFREAGIEIAFPQRDIHIRSVSQAIPLTQQPNRDSESLEHATESAAE